MIQGNNRTPREAGGTSADRLADEFEQAFRAGKQPRIEEFLARAGDADRGEALRELLKVEVELRRANRDMVSPDDYQGRFAGLESVVDDVVLATADFRHDAARTFASPRRAPAPSSDSGSGRLEVRCPNCRTPMEVAVDTSLTDLTCRSCGSHFSLVDQAQSTHAAIPLLKLGRFDLIERLGIGGFGSVWKARDKELDRTVALKIPRAGLMTAEEQEKFFREARAAAQLRHPNIVSVHEVGRDGDSVYIVSDLVRGITLGDWLTGQRPTSREAAQLCAKLADALHHAHQQGVVHRDLKPANIMLDGDGQPHLMDFGLARREVGEVTITMDGNVLGTPAYMSPEQAEGKAHTADRRSDIYSLGAILFQLLTGELPFRGNARMLMHQVIHDEPPSPRKLNLNISKDLETITLKCLEKEPAKRYQTAEELAEELRRFLAREPIKARPISRIERGWRWAKRKPAIAGLSTTVLALIAGTIIVLALSNARVNRESVARLEALTDKGAALISAKSNEKQAKKNADIANRRYFAAQMNLASQAWHSGNFARTVQLLETLRPKQGEPDLRGFEWRHLYHLTHANVIRRWQPNSSGTEIPAIAWPTEADWFATRSGRGAIQIWSGRTGELEGSIPIESAGTRLWDHAVSADGQLIAGAAYSGEVILWDVTSRRELRRWMAHPYGNCGAGAIAISPDKQFIVSSAFGQQQDVPGSAVLWDITGKRLARFTDSKEPIREVAFSPDSKVLVLATQDNLSPAKSLKFWKLGSTLEELGQVKEAGATKLAFSADGKTIWAGCNPGLSLRVIDAEKHVVREVFYGHIGPVTGVAAVANQDKIVTASTDRTLRLWDAANGKSTVIGAELSSVHSLAASADDRRIVCGDQDGWLTLRDLGLPAAVPTLKHGDVPPASKEIRNVRYSPDGRLLYLGFSPVNIVDAESLQLKGAQATGKILAISSDCSHVATYQEKSGQIDILNVAQGSSKITLPVGRVEQARFSPDKRFLATWTPWRENAVKLWDLQTGKSLEYGSGLPHAVQVVEFAPRGGQLAIGICWTPIAVWDYEDDLAHYHNAHPLNFRHVPTSLVYSPNGAILASGFDSGEIVLWDVTPESGKLTVRSELHGHTDAIRDIVFSPDGSQMVTASNDRSLRIWDVTLGQETITLKIHGKLMAFSPQGDRLAVVCTNNDLQILKASRLEAAVGLKISSKSDTNSYSESPEARGIAEIRNTVAVFLQSRAFEPALRLSMASDEDVLGTIIDAAFDPARLTADNATTIGAIRLVAGDAQSAAAALRLPMAAQNSDPAYHSTLGWCCLVQGDRAESQRAFEQCLEGVRTPDGTLDLKQATREQLTAAYFLDLISEREYIDRSGAAKKIPCYPWLFIGQRREIEGKPADATQAYVRCVELGTNPSHQTAAYARWRLFKLRDREDLPQPCH